MQYRRARVAGGTYFFTVVTFQRRQILGVPEKIELLRSVIRKVKQGHPFTIDALVIMPDHIHTLWTLPDGDRDYPVRWNLIKREFSRQCRTESATPSSPSRQSKGEREIWQRRYWEHQIRDDRDFKQHMDYIHYNPVKHGYVMAPGDWLFSSFNRYAAKGFYSKDWGVQEITFDENVGRE
ncbi:MAG: transposase [Deltaproteobacteria bacterium]|nr:transposase [Deltaproteobacteria bacterium]